MNATVVRDRHANGGQGMNWIRKEKRLAIYLRDGLACCYCGQGVEDGIKLTLDHLLPHADGGSNAPYNLVTACHQCNSARGNRPWRAFIAAVASYLNHDITAGQIEQHLTDCWQRPLDIQAAKDLIARRGGFVQALNAAE